MDATTLYVLIAVFVATLIRSVFGFGETLVAVPLLALRLRVNGATPLAVLVSITVAAVIVAQEWRKIHLRSTGWLVPPTMSGIPLGLWLLTSGPPARGEGDPGSRHHGLLPLLPYSTETARSAQG